jgi:NAD-dependent dihydropyrimidine dehydrogenase PreA subunit
MAFVITDRCVGVKNAACVEVCPCDCIHPRSDEPGFEDAKQLYIDPDPCIDCGLCAGECPVRAIYQDVDLPDELRHFIQINADRFTK